MVPSHPEVTRFGLDAEVTVALQDLDDLVRDMRADALYPSGVWDESSAVKFYLMYLSMLVDVVLADIGMSALNSNDMMVYMKQRLLVEYAAKAMYFDEHPTYALAMMTVGAAEDALGRLAASGAPANLIEEAEAHRNAMRSQFASVANCKRVAFSTIMQTFAEPDDYASLYGAPSILLHGDPEGIRQMMRTEADGTLRPYIDLPIERVNALLVDSGTNTLLFCERFIGRFTPDDEMLLVRFRDLRSWFRALLLKHDHGRKQEALNDLRAQLADATTN